MGIGRAKKILRRALNYDHSWCVQPSVPQQRPACRPRVRCRGRWKKSTTVSPRVASAPTPVPTPAYTFPGGLVCGDRGAGSVLPSGSGWGHLGDLCAFTLWKRLSVQARRETWRTRSTTHPLTCLATTITSAWVTVHMTSRVFLPMQNVNAAADYILSRDAAYAYFDCGRGRRDGGHHVCELDKLEKYRCRPSRSLPPCDLLPRSALASTPVSHFKHILSAS